MDLYFQNALILFRQHGNPDIAQEQMRYMRYQFEYFGLKMPAWSALTKQLHQQYGIPKGADLQMLIRLCFQDDHRELHYFALETLQKALKQRHPEDHIVFLEELILTRSWWDTVDWIRKFVGQHFMWYPHLIPEYTTKWSTADNIWLQRMSLIFQLSYKDKTDSDLLFRLARQLSPSKEFFVQKGSGWALREYAKTNPDAVRQFVAQHNLAPLTKREALKRLKSDE